MRWRVLVVTAMIVTGAGAQVAPFCPTVLRRSADDAFITVRGTGFTSASVVRWSVLNNVVTPLPTRLIDSTELRATVASVLRSNIDISQASLAVVTGSVVQTLGSIQIDHSDGIRLGGFCAIEPKAATAGRRQLAVTIYGYEMRIPLTLVFGPAVGLTSAPRGGGTVTSVTLPAEALQRPGFLNCQVLNPPANLQTPQAPFGIQLNPEPVITGLAAQTVFAGLASSQTLQVSQGTPPYNSWRLRTRDGGAAPAGFSVTPATADSS
ncbi:MAG: hypothetical protein JNN08_30880, partial [Bryobacterales bacterium]|nr:hypothetical protein [Bryobacterales bacterium]